MVGPEHGEPVALCEQQLLFQFDQFEEFGVFQSCDC